jgi:hypothetical protein
MCSPDKKVATAGHVPWCLCMRIKDCVDKCVQWWWCVLDEAGGVWTHGLAGAICDITWLKVCDDASRCWLWLEDWCVTTGTNVCDDVCWIMRLVEAYAVRVFVWEHLSLSLGSVMCDN